MIKFIKKTINLKLNKVEIKSKKYPVELAGHNWKSNPHLPIAIIFNFNPWKRDIFQRFFSEYRVAYAYGKNLFKTNIYAFLNTIKKDNDVVIVTWGMLPLPYLVRLFLLENKSAKLIRVEDAFIRSHEVGVLHTRPASIAVDNKGMHFLYDSPSDIEELIRTYDFSSNIELLERARTCIKLFKNTGLSKYYDGSSFLQDETVEIQNNYSILVIGQVENDASIKYGSPKIKTNYDLVKAAKKDFPEANIYFRPHPDYVNNNRKDSTKLSEIEKIAVVLDTIIPLHEILTKVEHIYTMTSLVGMEALIHDKKVTTCGAPFYSGWGLTDDKIRVSRRNKKRSLEELFAISYLVYPRYFHTLSDEQIDFEESVYYMLMESVKDLDIFELENNKIYQEIFEQDTQRHPPVEILKYLVSTKFPAEANNETILEIVNQNFKLRDYMQISSLLISTSNYDSLVSYSNLCISHLANELDKYKGNTTLLDNFLYSLSLSQRNSNGRIINNVPDLVGLITKIPNIDKRKHSIIKHYITCCSNSLQYDLIEMFLQEMPNEKSMFHYDKYWGLKDFVLHTLSSVVEYKAAKTAVQVLLQKPSRSERNYIKRYQLKNFASQYYLDIMNDKHASSLDLYLNRCLYFQSLDQVFDVENELTKLLKQLGGRSVVDFVMNRNRLNDLLSITNYLIKKKRKKSVSKLIDDISRIQELKDMGLVCITILNSCRMNGEIGEFYNLFDKNVLNTNINEKYLAFKARLLREEGHLSLALSAYKELYCHAKTLAKKQALNAEMAKIDFLIESSKILNSVPQPKLPKGVIFIAHQTCFNTLAMMVPSYVELKKMGYAVIDLTQGMTTKSATHLHFIDKFHGIIPLDLTKSGTIHDLDNEWEIDWKKRKVINGDINYYQGFYERLSTYLRKYHVDINEENAYSNFASQLLRADTCLSACKSIYNELVIEKGIPVSFVTGNSHVVPYSVFRDFAMHKQHAKLGFINCNVAYEAYFSNLGSKFANTMCVTDMTLHTTIRAPFLPRKDQFEEWYSKNQNEDKYLDKACSLINVNRVGSETDEKAREIVDFLKRKKSEGKKILCAFGKVPVDLNVPFDGGPAHCDMADWINHTVSVCGQCDDVILLVKPHPHELRPEIALDLIDCFNDLVTGPIPDNVYLLGHKDINGHALAPYLDLAILYNGSSSLELTSQGIPVIMTSYFGKYDYPVDLIYPENREQYEDFIKSLNYPRPNEETRKRSAFLMCYMGTEEISILNQYSIRPITNDKIGIPKWRKSNIKDFLQNGDERMTYIASCIVEKFENNSIA